VLRCEVLHHNCGCWVYVIFACMTNSLSQRSRLDAFLPDSGKFFTNVHLQLYICCMMIISESLVPSRNLYTNLNVAKRRCRHTGDSRTALATVLKLFFFRFGVENLRHIRFSYCIHIFPTAFPFKLQLGIKMYFQQKQTNFAQTSGKSKTVQAKATAFVIT